MCYGTVVASWSLTLEITGMNPFAVMANSLVTEFNESIRKNSDVVFSSKPTKDVTARLQITDYKISQS